MKQLCCDYISTDVPFFHVGTHTNTQPQLKALHTQAAANALVRRGRWAAHAVLYWLRPVIDNGGR